MARLRTQPATASGVDLLEAALAFSALEDSLSLSLAAVPLPGLLAALAPPAPSEPPASPALTSKLLLLAGLEIRLIPAAALQAEAGSRHQLAQLRLIAVRAPGQGLGLDTLQSLQMMPAGAAMVFIDWHWNPLPSGPVSSPSKAGDYTPIEKTCVSALASGNRMLYKCPPVPGWLHQVRRGGPRQGWAGWIEKPFRRVMPECQIARMPRA